MQNKNNFRGKHKRKGGIQRAALSILKNTLPDSKETAISNPGTGHVLFLKVYDRSTQSVIFGTKNNLTA
jgi:hypothetical protein